MYKRDAIQLSIIFTSWTIRCSENSAVFLLSVSNTLHHRAWIDKNSWISSSSFSTSCIHQPTKCSPHSGCRYCFGDQSHIIAQQAAKQEQHGYHTVMSVATGTGVYATLFIALLLCIAPWIIKYLHKVQHMWGFFQSDMHSAYTPGWSTESSGLTRVQTHFLHFVLNNV